ncbi:acyltransferase family protein [Leptospira perdikensis]|uniref:Acyltransferase n=1 Tax=Leptospira perdikensis TaxID=2484948 RepID=A0A4R9JGV7_9LEPT|nr:acyltransferase [Leptospira perdikensis]TGL41562.1 acyltransferase [Leptospira perdikensis]
MEWELLGIILAGLGALYLWVFQVPYSLPHPLTTKKTRENRFDFLRGLAMVGIVIIHVHSYFYFFHPADTSVVRTTLFLSNLSRFSVPLFILTSAIFLRKKEGYWISKLKNLILPYTIASVIGYLIKYSNYTVLELIQFYFLGKVFAPFYFVPLLVQFYLFFFIFDRYLMNKKFSKGLLLFSFLINLTSNLGFFDSILPKDYHSISILNYIFFFILGIQIGLTQENENIPKTNVSLVFGTFFIVFLFFVVLFSGVYALDFKNHHLIYPIFFFLVIWELLPKLNHTISDMICYIGNNSLFIFLLHPFVIHMMHSFDPYSFGGPFFGYLFTLILNVGIPLGIAITIQKGKSLYQSRHFAEPK